MFTFAKILFDIKLSECTDKYLLFGIRNYFCPAFVDASARLRDNNAVSAVFDQELATNPAALRRFQKPPLPFAFHLPLLNIADNEPSACSITLTIAGTAVNHLAVFLLAMELALDELAAQASISISVSRCCSVASDGGLSELSDSGDGLILLSSSEFVDGAYELVKLELVTPLRLIRQGKVLRDLSFPNLVRSLMRRVSSLAYYYGNIDLECDFKWLSEISTQARVVAIDMQSAKWPVLQEGMLGSITYSGVAPEFQQFLQTGSEFNAGKGAAYGGGEFRMLNSENEYP
ncbi:CRISPR system precrRNA processing endoribonuclease RAMP protein Cas6 [Geobacter pelophilus]|uniref:CRISPR system precrRNA processing endoribonuclease RAMP protein Cas6 n=1 Tax=Geoanaerobacter pelophilus TaxID=60036 RepID=A0AAW4L5U8_9BACT|nr:CRISPR system precrRNA processing endoribonuclease RAMP protein Cas6 [Geoanaerobacter pelophilus]MBT0666604.1 CRISPR system precrRNA processing endoribonuclease RAMP protein Cas6 [Geoanaerobacter pelophilus]